MAYGDRLVESLRKRGADFEQIELGKDFYTAQETAKALDIRLEQFAKVVMVRAGRENLIMAVVPANCQVKLKRLKKILLGVRTKRISLAGEWEFKTLFPGCEVGAMPPFGGRKIPLYVDKRLRKVSKIFFKAGTHRFIIQMSSADYFRLVQPQVVGNFAVISIRPWWRKLLRKFFKKLWRWIIS